MYRSLMRLAGPVLRWHLNHRAKRGKELPERLRERFGIASLPRPAGTLAWFHAASVGEAMAVLPLVEAVLQRFPTASVLLTTGTVTSARILAKRLPDRALHQFLPADQPDWITRFLDHWQPDAVIWTESELWPCWLAAIAERHIAAAMVNGRLSARSARRWTLFPGTLRRMLSLFTLRLAQSEGDAARLSAFAPGFRHVGNLKTAAVRQSFDEQAAADLRRAIGKRPFWLAASTHPGEEAIILEAHKTLATELAGLLTILVPRHPSRADDVAALVAGEGLTCDRRSAGALPQPDAAIYLADTLGEMGLFYSVSPVAFIGGSFNPGVGIHSPVEAVQGKAAIVYGPYSGNNGSLTELLEQDNAAVQAANARELAQVVEQWLKNPGEARRIVDAASAVMAAQGDVMGRVMAELEPMLLAAGFA